MSLRQVPWWQWLGFGAGIVAFVAMFLPWTALRAADPEVAEALRELPAGDVVRTAWHSGFFAWSAPILLLVAGVAAVVFGQSRVARVNGLPHLWLIVAVLSLLLLVLGWWLIDWQFSEDQRGVLQAGGVSIEPALGRFLGLAAAVASVAGSVFDVRAARARYGAKR
ncbi:hypothetical protein [Amycolatopsis magusensis]|uniref:Tryptophan-associated transmembrane protein (Trp_oprn_chp) n=1 Tax=Amycolatopsis magusensis TaxID=882444 RepID=A0ABS4Q4Z1_9PSEU|nr:hypothetical protein [Amycolatopsis magusensis]MBP2186751.1 hypothetical protein [Amycolatopsis magusensis]MDI5979053.1 hypothetical protein [Amycolatopsis magusensis]